MKRTGKTVKTSGEREHGGAESTADQVCGVGADISTFMVSVDGEVKSHQLHEVVAISETKLVGKVETVILVLLDRGDLSTLEDVLIDSCSNGWELGDQVHGVLESVSPVLGLLHALSVCLGKSRFVLESVNCDGELCHWVEIAGASVDKLLDELWNIGTSGPVCRQVADLLFAGDLTGEEKPEKTWQIN